MMKRKIFLHLGYPKTGSTSIQEFLNKGGTVTTFTPGARSEEIEYTGGFYGKRRKQKEAVAEANSNDE